MNTWDPQGDGRNSQDEGDGLLTRIREAYTLAATPETGDEVEDITVRHFLDTLAEVALAMASRKQAGQE